MTVARLATQSLSIGYPSRVVARDVCLEIAPGEVVAILGASGSGKSTLLSTLAGVTPALSGVIRLDGRDITSTPIHQRGIGLVFQEPLLFLHLSVLDNVTYGLRRRHVAKSEARARADELLDWLDLGGFGSRRVDELSGGQAQRVALARALAPRPTALLLDEPFSALDTDLRQRLATDVSLMLRREGVSAIHVTHDRDEAAAMADRVLPFTDISRSSLDRPSTDLLR